MKHAHYLLPGLLAVLLCAGLLACKKNPVTPNGQDTTKCDTCHIDTTHHCDTCVHDTSHHQPGPNDSTSHNFAWKEYSLPSEGILTGCWVFGPNNIYVVGSALWKWDGTSWTDISPMSSKGYSLKGKLSGFTTFALSENDYWLIDGDIAFHCDGSVAQDIRTDSLSGSSPLHSAWGTSSSDMYVVGDGGTILHFDGTQWTKMNSGTTKNLYSIWGTSDQNIWACGFNSTTAESGLAHFDGNTWQAIDPKSVGNIGPGADGITAVWTCDSASVPITVLSGSQVWRKTGSQGWRPDSPPAPNALSGGGNVGLGGLRGNGANDIMACGGWGWIGHWNGRSWMRYDALYDLSNSSYGAGAISMKGNTVCVVGLKNGSSWIAIGQR